MDKTDSWIHVMNISNTKMTKKLVVPTVPYVENLHEADGFHFVVSL